ncbi:MAG: alpha-1,4-glucan--maltose-1-phosphate maltosyltransferase [Verrucomicrobia bacterium]|nr:alpha-1,4-glucan--maltose-1-phosphate maltosyltransferase [Verrucomicrobiota bacterium]
MPNQQSRKSNRTSGSLPTEPKSVVIENVTPSIAGGRHSVKRVPGEQFTVEADIFKDGHDELEAVLKWKTPKARVWQEVRMLPLENDRWSASCSFNKTGKYQFTIEAWGDSFFSWLHDLERRLDGDQTSFDTEFSEGSQILLSASTRALSTKKPRASDKSDSDTFKQLSDLLLTKASPQSVVEALKAPHVFSLVRRWPDRHLSSTLAAPLPLVVERPKARFSAWYEFFPRCAEGRADKHSTFRDCLPRLQDAADMGFDVVYFPPIHPIGRSHRKGKNNSVSCKPGEPGSPWAIGAKEGGHYSIAPELGTLDDFKWLIGEALDRNIEIAIDFAINCSPDHPYVKEHPEWFFHRPDGTIKYAENPPKKYQDIYPLNFLCDDWQNLWREMVNIVLFWVDHGIHIFRVDNPHTKPVAFWEYLIAEVHKKHPDILFLAEAFTQPKMMQALGKIGFTQSYTYFTWRESKEELSEYVTELTQGPMRDYYRANFWPNTPDILPYHLQDAAPAVFKIRAALAAMLSSSWGIYSGFELCENQALPGREEYLDSEKYQLKERDWNSAGNIKEFIKRLNQIRQENPALHEYANIEFIPTENDQIIAWIKWTGDCDQAIIVIVNLDPKNTQESMIQLPLEKLGIPAEQSFEVSDLMFDESYNWQGHSNFISLSPRSKPMHVLKIVK